MIPDDLPPATGEALDLTSCESEPIRIPGTVQPHGMVFILSEPDLVIRSVGANVSWHLGLEPDKLLGNDFGLILPTDTHYNLSVALRDQTKKTFDPLPVSLNIGGQHSRWTLLAHRHGGWLIAEMEPRYDSHLAGAALSRVSSSTKRLQEAGSAQAACEIAVEEIRHMAGFDRVKLYRFDSDWSGEVLAEALAPGMDSYLGLHFPASDIPVQARELYQSNTLRLIVDSGYEPSPLIPSHLGDSAGPIDLSQAALRSVSPIHLEYLRNMGVGASMSVSILRDGKLWGLIACHHRQAHFVEYETREACELLAQVFAWQLDVMDRLEIAGRGGRTKTLRAHLLAEASSGLSVKESLFRSGTILMGLMEASGFAMLGPDIDMRIGQTPEIPDLQDLLEWLPLRDDDKVFETDRLPSLYPPAANFADVASGLLAIPLSRPQRSFLLWFRPERLQTVIWAGKPTKEQEETGQEVRLHPRKSFAAWSEEVRGRAQPWPAHAKQSARLIRGLVLDLIVREKDELERENLQLVRSARELETFIYFASHDIKEPLRQMEMLASMMKSRVSPEATADAISYFAEFRVLSSRLRKLTEELSNFARIGRDEKNFASVKLGEVVEEVLAQLRKEIAALKAEIIVGPLPEVMGERAQLHQVFINLLGNALKYREAGTVPRITIDAKLAETMDPDHHMAAISVSDNGIGFEAKYADKVFDAFWRLYPRDRYDGSGIGLAICRRIIERHGGRIEASGEPGKGAKFTFYLSILAL